MAPERASSVGAHAVTSEAQAAASDGFVTYDELGGPQLDTALWSRHGCRC
jgi:hypothetical protein